MALRLESGWDDQVLVRVGWVFVERLSRSRAGFPRGEPGRLETGSAAPRTVHPIRGIEESTLLSDELPGRTCAPIAFVWGADDPQGGARTAEAFVARIPGATLEMMSDTGHAPWIDDPDHVASVVGAFLAAGWHLGQVGHRTWSRRMTT